LEKVGVSKAYLTAQARGYGMKSSTDITTTKSNQYEQERVCKRFWVALILTDLVQEVSLIEIQNKYGVPRGIAQGLQDRASRYAGMLSAFCARIGWTDMEALISTFQARVLHGVRPEMLELMQIPRVKPYAARLLYKAGFKTPASIAAIQDPEILQKILTTSSKRGNASAKNMVIHCRRIIFEARELLQRCAAALQQQAQDVLRYYLFYFITSILYSNDAPILSLFTSYIVVMICC
jgi:DNA polymerase theta